MFNLEPLIKALVFLAAIEKIGEWTAVAIVIIVVTFFVVKYR